jgi:hypothetical protein
VTDLAALVVRMQADNSQYVKALDQATTKLSKFAKDQEDILGSLAGKFAAALSVGGLAAFTASSLENAASLDRMSQSAGVSVEALSSLKLAAAASGLTQDELGLALKKLNVNIAEAAGNANSKAGVAFKAMGISVLDASGHVKTADVVLGELATKFAGYADGPNKTAIAVQLLGRQGQNLIPVLNQGAAGLEEFKKQALDAGLVMSGQTAEAAEAFEQKAAVLKSTLVDGLGIQLSAKLLPILNGMADAFFKSGNAGETLATVADMIVAGLRIVATIGLEVARTFVNIGDGLGSLAAQAVALAHGRFAEVNDIARAGGEQEAATNKKFADLEAALWHDQSAKEIADAKAAFDAKQALNAKKPEAPNLAAAGEGNTALKELEKYANGIKDQSLAFDLGGAALTRYKLQFGPLADAIKAAGAEGQKVAAQAQGWADKLQLQQDTKKTDAANDAIIKQIALYGSGSIAQARFEASTGELGKSFDRMGAAGEAARAKFIALKTAEAELHDTAAVQALIDKTESLAGHLRAAADAAFDLQNKALKENLTATGNTAGLAAIDAQRQQVDWQGQINELNLKADQIKTDLDVTTTKLNAQVSSGQITELQGELLLADARKNALAQLQGIGTQEQAVADAAGESNVQLVDGVKKFQASLVSLQAQTTQLENSVRSGLESAFADNFSKLISGAESFRKALKSFFLDIEKQLDQLVSKNLAQSIFGAGGAGGGIAGGIASLFGGGSNSGGGLGSLFGSLFSTSSGAGGAAVSSGTGEDALSSLAGLGFAAGGTISAGTVGLVGENGPELAYAGAKDMHIQPMSAASKTQQITNHFVIQSSGGQISRASQMQTAAAAARSISQANRRNNA